MKVTKEQLSTLIEATILQDTQVQKSIVSEFFPGEWEAHDLVEDANKNGHEAQRVRNNWRWLRRHEA